MRSVVRIWSRGFTTQQGQWTQSQAAPDCINFALGQPSPSLLPLDAFSKAAAAKWGAADADPLMLQYGHPAGHHGFRTELAQFLSRSCQGEWNPDHLLVTGGNSSATGELLLNQHAIVRHAIGRCRV